MAVAILFILMVLSWITIFASALHKPSEYLFPDMTFGITWGQVSAASVYLFVIAFLVAIILVLLRRKGK